MVKIRRGNRGIIFERSIRVTAFRRAAFALLITCVWSISTMAQARLSGSVKIDGSSTVAPITMAAAELFQGEQPRVRVTVGISGTGGGFKKFLSDRADLRTDINDASRPIKPKEMERAKMLGVEFIEIPVAYDGIAVTVHPSNDFCDSLTVEELKRIWEPGSEVRNWNEVRPEFPDLPLKLYGPDTDSGTFDYFTEVIMGKSRESRSDYTASTSDNVLVMGIAGDHGSLGYFGYSYFAANRSKLKLLGVADHGATPIQPTAQTIGDGTYTPLSRPLFLYVNREAAKRAEVRAYVNFILDNAKPIVEHPKVAYVALPGTVYGYARDRLHSNVTGSAMEAARKMGKPSLSEAFKR